MQSMLSGLSIQMKGLEKYIILKYFLGIKYIYIYEKNLCPSLKCDQNAELKIT